MKTHLVQGVEFVECYRVDPKNKEEHNKQDLTDDGCQMCMEYYQDLKDDIIDEFIFDNKDREYFDIMEIEHDTTDTDRLNFVIWSKPEE